VLLTKICCVIDFTCILTQKGEVVKSLLGVLIAVGSGADLEEDRRGSSGSGAESVRCDGALEREAKRLGPVSMPIPEKGVEALRSRRG
jgi:hypothetical protein